MYALKETVFVKLKGHSAWPAIIDKIEKLKTLIRFHIVFYGTHQTAICSEKEIFPFYNFLENEIPKNQSIKPDFQKALDEAKKSLLTDTKLELHSHDSKTNYECSEQELKEKILNLTINENQDLETSLSLAAEAGTLLLGENNSLKQQISDLNEKYFILQSELEDKLKTSEEQIENFNQLLNNLKKDFSIEKSHLLKKIKDKEQMLEDFEEQTEKDQSAYESKIKSLEDVANKNKLYYEEHLNLACSSLKTTKEEYQQASEINDKMSKMQTDTIEKLKREIKSLRETINLYREEEDTNVKKLQLEKENLERCNIELMERIEFLELTLALNSEPHLNKGEGDENLSEEVSFLNEELTEKESGEKLNQIPQISDNQTKTLSTQSTANSELISVTLNEIDEPNSSQTPVAKEATAKYVPEIKHGQPLSSLLSAAQSNKESTSLTCTHSEIIVVKPIIHQYSDGSYPVLKKRKQNFSGNKPKSKNRTDISGFEIAEIQTEEVIKSSEVKIHRTQTVDVEKIPKRQRHGSQLQKSRIFINSAYNTRNKQTPLGSDHIQPCTPPADENANKSLSKDSRRKLQTPKLSTYQVTTQGLAQVTTDQLIGKSGGDSQTPSQKQSTYQ
ncbi:hypothetical protein J6590_107753, partial [Homalodisca vitripennis]